jgi:ABC-type histidine transport system ATPase subunit
MPTGATMAVVTQEKLFATKQISMIMIYLYKEKEN